MRIEVEGLDKLLAQLAMITNKEYVIQGTKEVIGEQVKTVEQEAKSLCPVDTGQLRNSIESEVEVKGNKITGVVSTNCEYAPYVEFGTGIVGEATRPQGARRITYRPDGWWYYDEETKQFIYTIGQPAQPYLYPALKNNEEEIGEDLKKGIMNIIKEAIKK